MALTITDLLTAKTSTDLKAILLANLQARGMPTTDWSVGSIDRTLVEAFCDSLADQYALTPEIVAGVLTKLATGDFLTLLADQIYDLQRYEASYTIGNVLLTAGAGVGPTAFTAGSLRVVFPTGNVYVNTAGGSVPLSGTLSTPFKSESPNNSSEGLNYIDGNNTLSQFLVGKAGITPSNPAPTFSPVTLVGPSTGTVTPSGGSPTPSSVVIRIDSSGDNGVATFSYQVNGGSYVSGGFTAPFAIPGIGVTVTFANGAGTPYSFLKDDTFSFVTPGSWITAQGTDQEADEALRARCLARWPSLSASPTEDAYAGYARAASGSVTQVRARASSTVPGGVDVVIAGQGGALAPAIVTTVQDYINQYTSLTDRVLVQSASSLTITIAATVYVQIANLATAQSELQTAMGQTVLNASIGGTVYLAQVIENIMASTGVVNTTGVTINSVASDLVLGANQVGSFTQQVATSLTWITV